MASAWKLNLIGSMSDLSFYEAAFNGEMENELVFACLVQAGATDA